MMRDKRSKTLAIDGATPAAMPSFIKPQLATLKSKAPKGRQWLHEIKYTATGSKFT
jgi:bifunctional non-homologous end joining protein LigD